MSYQQFMTVDAFAQQQEYLLSDEGKASALQSDALEHILSQMDAIQLQSGAFATQESYLASFAYVQA
ncbi:MAG: hypothetical protein H6765_10010 [Candidatus Peribacteria bacterium]|nr:MAG: hypothetical protein H6765_10010 [Candidatus Peribacteria bacterium]